MGLWSKIVTPLEGKNFANHFMSVWASRDNWTWFLSCMIRNTWSKRFKKNLEECTHLLTYRRLPNRDYSWCLLQWVLQCHKWHFCNISCSFSGGIESVKFSVLTNISRQLTHVEGLTNFWEISKRRWTRSALGVKWGVNVAWKVYSKYIINIIYDVIVALTHHVTHYIT